MPVNGDFLTCMSLIGGHLFSAIHFGLIMLFPAKCIHYIYMIFVKHIIKFTRIYIFVMVYKTVIQDNGILISHFPIVYKQFSDISRMNKISEPFVFCAI